ncbi:sigma-B regulation protein RsbU (phosphoserine phosphatase) [Saccharopolyspora lacisalsi]|uniref:Sigma-B regulation protein RsbU (Phosphoserine phosphatase) n=1 Tax=Halosaccharopolyspora lacisalsi TaxID=1000566 RepID=A0A839E4N1_9PSEU|nr:GAF domain-containing SpoIIE family protein phosphatase [Halosaccharopolyspora lacisalsi]MBA8827556.1 sigma-B regulation protein RsbU (phosphoserine phosphatase) [Halosaccharopolyspora lacisalsi]
MDDVTTEGDAEAARLLAVARYEVLDTSSDGAFDRIAALAARLTDAPMATVSLVGSDRIWFKATRGLGDAMTEIDREPGLCASAVRQSEPYMVCDTLADSRTEGNSLVFGQLGVRFYAAAPITTSDGHQLGTVNVLDIRPRELDDSELDTLRDLAGVVANELELRLSASTTLRQEQELRERVEGYASTLQRTLLPPSLPEVPGLELACHYHAASPSEVTGDFYDVFFLGNDRWAFFLGDVSGHGATAASVTSLVRYTLRAAALHNSEPTEVLSKLNDALLLDSRFRQPCTVLFGILRPGADGGFDVTIAGGGHPPALWLGQRGEENAVREIWPKGGMLVGALPDASFATADLHLKDGEALLLYTDGITEARPGSEFFGEEGLTEFLAHRAGTAASGVIDDLTELIDGFDPPPIDDVALLALSVPAAPAQR